MSFSFFLLVYRLLPTVMALRLDFAATIRCLAVFRLKSNMLVKRHSNFLELGFFTGVDAIGTLGLLSVTTSGVESVTYSIISLRFCWSSNLPAC